MKTRKLVLIIADVVLLAVCIVQGILAAHDGVKYFKLQETPDEYTIVTPAETIHLVQENEKWIMNGKYAAGASSVKNFADAVENIRALDKVASAGEVVNTKYELTEGKKISVEVKKGNKVVRSLELGKDASSGSQTYITVDGGKEIYLAAGNLRTIFDKSISSLRDRYVWSADKNELTSVTISKADGETWGLTKMGSGTDVTWNITGVDTQGQEIDTEKTANWFETLAIMTAASWYDDSATAEGLGGNLVLNAKVVHGFNTINFDLYQLPVAEGAEDKYYATTSETPFIFEVPDYQVKKYTKDYTELLK